MTIEEYIVQELKEEKEKRAGAEATVKELSEAIDRFDNLLKDVEWLIRKTVPRLTKEGFVYATSTFFAHEDDIARVSSVYKRLGIKISVEKEEEKEWTKSFLRETLCELPN